MYKSLAFAEKVLAYFQGKGYGASTTREEVRVAFRLLGSTPSIALDLGANKGEWTHWVHERAPSCRVLMFEPQPSCVVALRRRFESCPTLEVVEAAVSDSAGSLSLYFDEEGSGLASLNKRELRHFGLELNRSVTVKTIVLDDFLEDRDIESIDLLKLDVEGLELSVFRGLKRTLTGRSPPRVIQFEFGGCNIDSRTYFRDFYYLFADRYEIFRQTPFGLSTVSSYSEQLEVFRTTNYFMRRREHNQTS